MIAELTKASAFPKKKAEVERVSERQPLAGEKTELMVKDNKFGKIARWLALHCNFLRQHFQPFSLNLVLPSVVKPSGEIAERGKRHPT